MKKRIIALLLAVSLVSCFAFVGCDEDVQVQYGGTTFAADAPVFEVSEGTDKTASLNQSAVSAYIEAMRGVEVTANDYCFNDQAGAGVLVKDFWEENTNSSAGNVIVLNWKASKAPYAVKVATNEQMEDAYAYVAEENSLRLLNLYMATTYYWSVTDASGATRELNSFTTSDTVRTMYTGYVNNVRDLGGRMTSSGKRVKQGVIYRGAEMNLQTYVDENSATHYLNLRNLELTILKNQLNVKTELDFRTDAETRGMSRSALGDEVAYRRNAISAYTGMFCKHSNGTEKPEMRKLYQDTLRLLATASKDNVIYFHCWGGADRTGTIGFLVNGLLGVSYTDLLIDFELTTFSNNFRSREDNPDYYNYFNSMVTELKANYQRSEDETISTVIERYMKECLYLSDADITALKTNLLED